MNLLTNVSKVRNVKEEQRDGSKIKSNQKSMVLLEVGPERITPSNVYCILVLDLIIMSFSGFDKKEVTTNVKSTLSHFTDRRDSTTFSIISMRPSDGLYVTILLLHWIHIDGDDKSVIDTHRSQDIGAASSATAAVIWNHRTGRADIKVIREMIQNRRYGMLSIDVAKTRNCSSCTYAK